MNSTITDICARLSQAVNQRDHLRDSTTPDTEWPLTMGEFRVLLAYLATKIKSNVDDTDTHGTQVAAAAVDKTIPAPTPFPVCEQHREGGDWRRSPRRTRRPHCGAWLTRSRPPFRHGFTVPRSPPLHTPKWRGCRMRNETKPCKHHIGTTVVLYTDLCWQCDQCGAIVERPIRWRASPDAHAHWKIGHTPERLDITRALALAEMEQIVMKYDLDSLDKPTDRHI